MDMKKVYEDSRFLGVNQPESTYHCDLYKASLEIYCNLPKWEKIARSHAYAMVNQEVYIKPYDRLIGRTYHLNDKNVEKTDPDFDWRTEAYKYMHETYPQFAELERYDMTLSGSPGHITWRWDKILSMGTSGIRNECLYYKEKNKADEKALQLYNGILIMLDSMDEWNEKHIKVLAEMGKTQELEICKQVPKYPARNFREALQAYFFQHIVVMKEDPPGGNSPGRLDYYLWPYLEKDLKENKITLEEAEELCEELFLRIDERVHKSDGHGESVVLGGCHKDGTSAVNPLSYIMIKAFMKYDITHPYLYVRIPKDVPEDFLMLAAKYVKEGNNRAQILNDESIMNALINRGVSYEDAADYYCGGCMEVGIQGKSSDFLFAGFFNVPKILEFTLSGGRDILNHVDLEHYKSESIFDFDDFESFYAYFLEKAKEIFNLSFEYVERLSLLSAENRPSYLLCSMLDNCMEKGRNMHDGGIKYHDYGASPIGLPNTADSLFAIKKALFDEKICSKEELLKALEADFEGYEELHNKLKKIPKYGMENDEADSMCARLTKDISDIFASYKNRFGGVSKPVILSFVWAPVVGGKLAATPDGRKAGVPVAQSLTPQSSAMTKGITAAMNSCNKLPFDCFTGGASTMWDLDAAFASEEVIASLISGFFSGGGQIFQGNVCDVETLIKAQKNPEEYPNLIVRVGGYSARFMYLSKELQDDIINRRKHSVM
ncbi:MAG: hypothetical protein E7564_09030 [Ruminococcaceae bacterium]|nr:hypothetical protein [Oscillospiraceae bacterium]